MTYPPSRPNVTAALGLAFAVVSYLLGLLVTFAFFDFLAGTMLLPFGGVDHGAVSIVRRAILVDLALIALFGVTHSVMARPSFKARWTRVVPPHLERSCYVLTAALTLGALIVLWQPVPGTIWSAQGTALTLALDFLFAAGVALTAASTFQLSHAELLGLAQPLAALRGDVPSEVGFRTPILYRVVRHPMQLGFLITLWSTPVLTAGRALLAAALTLYVLIGLHFEERALRRAFGATYAEYSARVPRLLPRLTPQRAVVLAALVLVTLTVAQGADAHGGARMQVMEHAGLTRRYRVVLPPAALPDSEPLIAGLPVFIQPVASTRGLGPVARATDDAPDARAILFVLHGRGQDGALMRRLLGPEIEPFAAARGWIVVYPDGVEGSWNDCRAALRYPAHIAAVPDVSFLQAVARRLGAVHAADTSHVLAIGYSNGGHLAHRLAAESPEMVRAVAVFGANLPATRDQRCVGDAPTLFVVGTADRVNPAEGGIVQLPTGGTGSAVLSTLSSAEFQALEHGTSLVEPLVIAGLGHEVPVGGGTLRRFAGPARESALEAALRFLGDASR